MPGKKKLMQTNKHFCLSLSRFSNICGIEDDDFGEF